jgi:hypothetical protein
MFYLHIWSLWARCLYKDDYVWTRAENLHQLKDAFFKPLSGAKDVASESIKGVENLMRCCSGLNLNTANAALQYCRDFKAEANELMSKLSCKLTNYQLVDMFEKYLDKTFCEAIWVALTLNKAYREAQLKNRTEIPAPATPAGQAGENNVPPAATAPQVEEVPLISQNLMIGNGI